MGGLDKVNRNSRVVIPDVAFPAGVELCIERSPRMMTLLWIVAAQPMVFAAIFAVRGRRRSPKFLAKQKPTVRPSLPCYFHGQTDQI